MLEFMKESNEANKDAMKELLREKKTSDPLQNATTKMLDLAIAGVLGPKKNPEDIMYKMMETMIPNITERALEIATMNMDKDADGGGPLGMIEKFGDMVKPLLGNLGVGPAAAPPVPGMPYPAPPPPHMQPPAPLPPPSPVVPGVYPYTNAPAAAATPVPPVAPVPIQPVPGFDPPPHPGQLVSPGAAAPVPGQPEQGTPADAPDIHPQIFVFAKQYLDTGKDGSELAGWVDDRLTKIEAGTGEQNEIRLLSVKAIEFLETVSPAAIIDHFFAAAPPEILPYFCDPSGAVAPHARQFILEFCDFFFSSDDDEATPEAIAAAEAAEPTTAEPVAEAAVAEPVEVTPTAEAGPIQGEPVAITPVTPEGVTE
jgi:hypothetical protein